MPRYQLVDKVMFVEATNFQTGEKLPKGIGSPHIFDQREQEKDPTKPATYVTLNPGETFIARLIVQGIETTMIPEILKSEYSYLGAKVNSINFAAEVDTVCKLLKPYLEEGRTRHREYEAPKTITDRLKEGEYVKKHLDVDGKTPLKGYELDFRVNWFVVGCCKFSG